MNREQLNHLVRAAAASTERDDLMVIGSQASLGSYPEAARVRVRTTGA